MSERRGIIAIAPCAIEVKTLASAAVQDVVGHQIREDLLAAAERVIRLTTSSGRHRTTPSALTTSRFGG
ncbi:MAG TPA: hypothetical protein VNB49_17700 [Candidatus Dormibacteraeota bacterium]|nr:hypothetical protein [Candidatus Dormibacteraeota bacterium]